MPRKPVKDMTSDELSVYRKYMAQKKRESRARRSEPEKDTRKRYRAEYMRKYRKKT